MDLGIVLTQFSYQDGNGSATGIVTCDGDEDFVAMCENGEWLVEISHFVPPEVVRAIERSLKGRAGLGPVVLLAIGDCILLTSFAAHCNKICGTLAATDHPGQVPIEVVE